LLFFFIDSPQ
jgi:hypothetical protein